MLRRLSDNRFSAIKEAGRNPATTGFATATLMLRCAVGAFGIAVL
jgi:hypothetical protein